MHIFDASEYLGQGSASYGNTYGNYMQLFEDISKLPKGSKVVVCNVPASWAPVLFYLRADIQGPLTSKFASCPLVKGAIEGRGKITYLTRADIEVLSTVRPECSDALWRIDNVWVPERRRLELCAVQETSIKEPHGLVITTNASQYRPEVLSYLRTLYTFEVPRGKNKVLLVPCSADKPYPNEEQALLAQMLPDDSWYVCVVSGVLGLVPEFLYSEAPEYDAGIPMHWRVFKEVGAYFLTNPHLKVVCASEFYAEAIALAWRAYKLTTPIRFVFPTIERDDYENLSSPENLKRIEQLIN